MCFRDGWGFSQYWWEEAPNSTVKQVKVIEKCSETELKVVASWQGSLQCLMLFVWWVLWLGSPTFPFFAGKFMATCAYQHRPALVPGDSGWQVEGEKRCQRASVETPGTSVAWFFGDHPGLNWSPKAPDSKDCFFFFWKFATVVSPGDSLAGAWCGDWLRCIDRERHWGWLMLWERKGFDKWGYPKMGAV